MLKSLVTEKQNHDIFYKLVNLYPNMVTPNRILKFYYIRNNVFLEFLCNLFACSGESLCTDKKYDKSLEGSLMSNDASKIFNKILGKSPDPSHQC